MKYDVVTLGETMLRLTPPNQQRLEQTRDLNIEVAGSESNTAVGLSRLGLKVCWLSRLPEHPLGRMVSQVITSHGVDTSLVSWASNERLGLYYYEEGSSPRPSQVYYDRANSAMSHIQQQDLPSSLFEPQKARLFHTTGITLGLSQTALDTATHAVELAKKSNWLLSFDFNYRANLWNLKEAFQKCTPIMQLTDVLFIAVRDAKNALNNEQDTDPNETLNQLAVKFPKASIVMTMGEEGALARTPQGITFSQDVFPAVELGRLGRGDSFSAGFLYRWLSQNPPTKDLSDPLKWGAAMAALKSSIPGDMPLVDKEMLENLLKQKGTKPSLHR